MTFLLGMYVSRYTIHFFFFSFARVSVRTPINKYKYVSSNVVESEFRFTQFAASRKGYEKLNMAEDYNEL